MDIEKLTDYENSLYLTVYYKDSLIIYCLSITFPLYWNHKLFLVSRVIFQQRLV